MVHVVAIAVVVFAAVVPLVAIIPFVTVVALEALLHLRLCGCNNAVVMFSVLEIVLSHHTITGALRIPRKRHVFLRNMLRGSANLHIRTGTIICPGQRIGALTVESIIIAAPPAALILLS